MSKTGKKSVYTNSSKKHSQVKNGSPKTDGKNAQKPKKSGVCCKMFTFLFFAVMVAGVAVLYSNDEYRDKSLQFVEVVKRSVLEQYEQHIKPLIDSQMSPEQQKQNEGSRGGGKEAFGKNEKELEEQKKKKAEEKKKHKEEKRRIAELNRKLEEDRQREKEESKRKEQEKKKQEEEKKRKEELKKQEEAKKRLEEEKARQEEEIKKKKEEKKLHEAEKKRIDELNRKLAADRKREEEEKKQQEEEKKRKEEEQKNEEERKRKREEEKKIHKAEKKRIAELNRQLEEDRKKEEEKKRKEEEKIKEEETKRKQDEEKKIHEKEKKRIEELNRKLEADRKREEEEKRQQEEEKKRKEKEQKNEEERKRKQDEEKKIHEAEKKRIEELNRKLEADRKREEEERRLQEEEKKRQQEEQKNEEERKRKRDEEKKIHEAEKKRIEELNRKLEADRKREEEERRQQEEEKKIKEEEQKNEEERKRKHKEEKKRIEELNRKQEADRKREEEKIKQEEEKRKQEEEQKKKEEERKKKEDEIRKQEEDKIRKEQEKKRLEEEKRKNEEERKRKEEEKRKIEEEKRRLEDKKRMKEEENKSKELERMKEQENERINQEVQKQQQKEEEKKLQKEKENTSYEFNSLSNPADFAIRDLLDNAENSLYILSDEEVLKMCEEILKKYPKSPRANFLKAEILIKMAEEKQSNTILEQGITQYQKVLDLPDVPYALLVDAGTKLAEKQVFRGWNGKATKTWRFLSDKYPNDVKLKNKLGVSYLMANHNEEARKTFEKVLEMDHGDGLAKVHLGFIIKTIDNDPEKALPFLIEGVASEAEGTKDGRFYFHLGDAFQRLNLLKDAYKIYKAGAENGLFLSTIQRSLYNVNTLTGRPWWTAEETGYTEDLKLFEQSWKTIRDEGMAQLDAKTGGFTPESENLREKGEWKQFILYQRGQKNKKNCEKAPKTCELIDRMEAVKTNKRGQAKFSVIHPGTHIWPHCGPTNCRLRAHLGLKVPTGINIRVGQEKRTWKEGKFIIFDDSFEHEVWHNGNELRLVLIVDFWHPDLTEEQKKTLSPI